jgi:hypothetical protein
MSIIAMEQAARRIAALEAELATAQTDAHDRIADLNAELAKVKAENEWLADERSRSLADVEKVKATLPCGHPASMLLKSAETGEPLYCEYCDCIQRRNDAEKREMELKAERESYREMWKAEQREVKAWEAERDAIRELMNCYNLGGWTDALGPMKRALKAEAERDALKQSINRFHHVMQRAGLHPGRTDDDLLEILERHLAERDAAVADAKALRAVVTALEILTNPEDRFDSAINAGPERDELQAAWDAFKKAGVALTPHVNQEPPMSWYTSQKLDAAIDAARKEGK